MPEPIPPTDLPARSIPVPISVSPEAQQLLAPNPFAAMDIPMPARDDATGWKTMAEMGDAGVLAMMEGFTSDIDVAVEEREVDGVAVFVISPADPAPGDKVVLDIHGGAFFIGAGQCCRASSTLTAGRTGLVTWAVDYRVPPDHPYPAALDDCVAVYRALLRDHDASDIVVCGASAGGNLAAALMLRAAEEGLPLPGAQVLLSPEVDLTESGDSFQTNLGLDNVLTASLAPSIDLYAGDEDLTHPHLSPLFGEVPEGYPPTLVSSGTRDLFLSNAVRMHRKLREAGVRADLHVFEAMPHGGFMGAPEADEVWAEVGRFLATT